LAVTKGNLLNLVFLFQPKLALKNTDPLEYAYCDSPYACAAAPIISRKWIPVIVCHLLHGPKRHSELRRAIPYLSAKVLTQNLREMEAEALVERHVRNSSPQVEVMYSLTRKGEDLSIVIQAMNTWGRKWLPRKSSNARQHLTQKALPIVNQF
jgi:DNA-binding HxlR family transcriptional regulator